MLTPTYAANTGQHMANNNVAYGSKYVANLESITDTSNCAVPQYQAIRFSLIKPGTTTTSNGTIIPDGKAVTTSPFVNNPVTIQNTEVSNNFKSAHPFEADQIQQLVNPTYDETTSNTGHKLNSRRDYTGSSASDILITYKTKKVWDTPPDPDKGITGNYHLELNSSDDEPGYFTTKNVTIYPDDSIPLLISGGGSAKSFYQQTSNAATIGHSEWADMNNSDFFYEYTQAAFVPILTSSDSATVTSAVPDFTYRVLAYMMGYYQGPYKDQATFNAVDEAYKKYMLQDGYEILAETVNVYERRPNNPVEVLFGDVSYVGLTASELGLVADISSGIMYGYTNEEGCRNTSSYGDDDGNDFNFLLHGNTATLEASKAFFESLLLKNTEPKMGLLSLNDGVHNGSNTGALDQFSGNTATSDAFVNVDNKHNKYTQQSNYGLALNYGKTDSTGGGESALRSANYWSAPFYWQVYEDLKRHDDDLTQENMASKYSLGDYPDCASMITYGGFTTIRPQFSSIDIQVELQGVGAPTEYVTNSDGVKLPVYQDSYASSKFSTTDEETGDDYNSDSALYRGPSITFRAGMSLNFKDNATQWNDKVITDLNQDVDLYSPIKPSKVQISLDPTKASDPTSPNATQVRVAKDIGELSNDQIAYIPAYTKAEVTVTYAERLIAYYEI
jgi:hypothetical protein